MRAPSTAMLATGLAFLAGVALAQLGPDFMPPGGRDRLVDLLSGMKKEDVTRFLSTKENEEAWVVDLVALAPDLAEIQRRTLASYLAVNLPLTGEGRPADFLPKDGRELAFWNCQGCHSLFAGYLTHDRDIQGWRKIFESPFHRELRMTPAERETFARYSALNMPMRFEDVPDDLRF